MDTAPHHLENSILSVLSPYMCMVCIR